MIKLVRVDHRLIHGQVALTWTNAVGADCILVANDEVVNDNVMKTTLKLSAPHNVKVVIKSINDSASAINSGKTDKYNLFIVTKTIEDIYRLIEKTDKITTINIGSVQEKEGSKPISNSIFITDNEKRILKEIFDKKIKVFSQQVPTDKKIILNGSF